MPITWAFTIAAGVAVVLHLRKLRHHYLNRQAVLRSGQNGELRKIARLLLKQSLVRTSVNLLLIVAGGGILLGHRQAGYALALIPVVTSLATFFDPA